MKTLMCISMSLSLVLTSVACEKTDRTFSLLDTGSTFQQSPVYVQKKMDILWVVDNSGSMDSSQQNLVNSFNSFISKFQTLNLDFHMAVIGTDAYRAGFDGNAAHANILQAFRRGPIVGNATSGWSWSPDSGVSILDMLTPNLSNVFLMNASLGTAGSGDERVFQSMKKALDYSGNNSFRRPDAILAVILVSDEDDFSSSNDLDFANNDYDGEVNGDPVVLPFNAAVDSLYQLYQNPTLVPVSTYKTYLDGLVGAGNYSVNMIGILDTACKTSLNASYGGRRIGRRYMQMADLSGGVKASLCGNFGDSLKLISDSIIELSSTFKLGREPVVTTIDPIVDGVHVAQDANNGWSYNATDWSVTFNGTSVPAAGASIQILFTPVRAAN